MPNMLILTVTAAFAAVILFLRRGLYKLPPAAEQAGASGNGGGAAGNNTFSIIVSARNEAQNLPACLDSIFSQNIPADRYEAVIADDRSTDATPQILRDAAAKRPNLRVVTVTETPRGISPKKHAVTTAIAASKNAVIVFTDADCVVPPTWLDSIDRNLAGGAALVQGITTYSYPPGMNRLFWGLQSVDFLSHGIIAAAAIAAGLPINSNANNMAFRREAFMTDPAGAVETGPTPTLAALFEQRRRWGAVTVHYFNKKHLRKYIVPASIIQLPMVLIAVVSGVFGKFEWKGLKTRGKVKVK